MEISAECLTVDGLSADDRARWCAWQAADAARSSPFFRIEFTDAVAAVAPDVFVLKIWQAGEVVGYWPHQRRGGTLYPVGAPLNDYHGVIGPAATLVSLSLLVTLANGRRLSANSWVGRAPAGLPLATCQADLSGISYDEWYGQQSSAFAKYYKDKARSRRGLEQSLGPVSVRCDVREPQVLDQLIALKREQYRRTGRHDIFAACWTRQLLHRLLVQQEDFGASVAALYAGDTLVALELSLHAGSVWHFWFPAYLPQGARYSAGIWLSLETIRVKRAEGFTEFDYGFVGEPYKKYFCNRTREVAEVTVGQPSWVDHVGRVVRNERVLVSARRRWAAIDASETGGLGKGRGLLLAGKSMASRIRTGES
ncbi:GNAT family N-acetyltransferase [Brevundimonas pishanensis]|uniref:GNAT family N-acetyltransferase n=1 Tax=Brevundimonas pishanensis TaxID=2896315 RepID=UPI001FA6D1E1|nr:GNAT family N-acetyltransferase [Brevundimonas pishanensis]